MKSWRELYHEWENLAKSLSGEDLGVGMVENYGGISDERNMYEWLEMQRFNDGTEMESQRYRSNSCNIVPILDRLKMSSDGNLELEIIIQISQISELLRYLSDNGDGRILNPRNVRFDNPIDYDDKGRTTQKKEIYGHYRTDEYEDAQGAKGRDRPAVSDTWYNESMGQAKPPIWQALYGDEECDMFSAPSLQVVIGRLLAEEKIESNWKPYWTYQNNAQRKAELRYIESGCKAEKYPLHLPFSLLIREMGKQAFLVKKDHSRFGSRYRCANCNEIGHNRRTCEIPLTSIPNKGTRKPPL